jgi:hypothetical protein
MAEVLFLIRRWFVYTCAFIGAGWFGYAVYILSSHHIHIPGAVWIIIGAAVGVAFFLTFLLPLVTRSNEQPVSDYPPESDEPPESGEEPASGL